MEITSLRKKLLFLAMAPFFISGTSAETYQMRAISAENFSTWTAASPSYGEWSNQGSHINCADWNPSPADVSLGQSFVQSRSCQQLQTRTATSREYDSFSNAYRTTSSQTETQLISVLESRSSLGELLVEQWVPVASIFTLWVYYNEPHDYTSWSPAITTQAADFAQSRTYSQDQTRNEQLREIDTVSGQIRNTGASIQRFRIVSNIPENREVKVQSGTWSNTSASDVSAWTPLPTTQTASFTQSRSLTQNQERTWIYTDPSNAVLSSRVDSQALTGQSESRAITATSTAWANTGVSSLSAWSPAVGSQTVNFTQSRTYTQNQSRTWIYTDPASVSVGTYTETQSLAGQVENQSVVVTSGNWTDSGAHYACGTWTPDVATKSSGTVFTQTRSCSQNQEKVWSYSAGQSNVESRNESQVIAVSESQSATGTGPVSGTWGFTSSSYYYKPQDQAIIWIASYNTVGKSGSCSPVGATYSYADHSPYSGTGNPIIELVLYGMKCK
jgi:hypothetical protein